ncbi:MAG: phosphopantothenoylcysteine decarboxylase [Pseudomonadota bacterium]
MLAACETALPADVFVSVAAVADWRPAEASDQKLKLKDGDGLGALALAENPDILATIARKRKKRPALVVGFAAETHDVDKHAKAKLKKKGCDWIVANDVSGDVMGGADNEMALITATGVERWPRMAKSAAAAKLAERIAAALQDRDAQLAAE